MKKMGLLGVPLFAVMLGITACGASSKSAPAEATYAAMETAAEREYTESYDMAPGAAAGTGGTARNSKTASFNGEAPRNNETAAAPALPEGRKLIRTVNMQVETDQFDKMISGINARLAELGGYIEESDISGNSMNYRGEPLPRYANITARIPNDKLDAFTGAVSDSGNVTNRSESTQDVTLQYSDVESRKKSLEIEQERIWQFLEKAETIDTVITLEQRLSDIRYQLESMESQLRLYDNQVDYSTVYLSVTEVTAYTPVAPESAGTRIKNGLAENFSSLVTALTNLFVLLITTIPFWLPLLAAVILILCISRRHNRKIDRRLEGEKERRKPADDDTIQKDPAADDTIQKNNAADDTAVDSPASDTPKDKE